jgi:uncharacterized protein
MPRRTPLTSTLRAVARRPVLTLLLLLLAAVPLLAAGAGLRPDNSLGVWFVADDPALAAYHAFEARFGGDEVVAVAWRAPGDALAPAERALQARAARAVADVEGIAEVLAPGPLAGRIGDGPEARAYLGRAGLLSADGRSAVLLARMAVRPELDAERGRVLAAVREAVDGTLGAAGRRARYAGIGVLYDALDRQTIRDSGIYLSIAFVLMAALLRLVLGRWRAVGVVLVPPVTVSLATLGLFHLAGRPFTQVTSILPVLVLVIGVADALHLLSHYHAERRERPPADEEARREQVVRCSAFIARPNLFTALTTAAAFLALATSRIPAVRDLGLAAAVAMLLGWVATLLVGTAALVRWDLPPPPRRREGTLGRALGRLAAAVSRRRVAVLAGASVVLVLLLAGAARLRVDTYTLELLPAGHAVREDSRWIEEEVGHYTPLEFTVRATDGPATGAETLRRLVLWQEVAEARPDVDRTFGLAEAALAGRGAPGAGWLSADGTEARVTAFVPMSSAREFTETLRALEADGARVMGGAGTLTASGYLPLYLRIVEYVVSGTLRGLAVAAVVVLAMLVLLFRSSALTAAAVPANLLPVALVFGVMGWTGIPLDIATATIGTIVLGIAVDDTIHFLYRYRAERRAGLGREEAVERTCREAGRPIVLTTLVLALGFAVLATSGSLSIAYFGVVATLAIVGAMLADLLVLPALLLSGRRVP